MVFTLIHFEKDNEEIKKTFYAFDCAERFSYFLCFLYLLSSCSRYVSIFRLKSSPFEGGV